MLLQRIDVAATGGGGGGAIRGAAVCRGGRAIVGSLVVHVSGGNHISVGCLFVCFAVGLVVAVVYAPAGNTQCWKRGLNEGQRVDNMSYFASVASSDGAAH